MAGQRAGGYIDNARKQFSSDLIHIRDHQKQSLGCGKRCRQSTCGQGSVHSTSGAALGLHFHNLDRLSKDILSALSCPLIGYFSMVEEGVIG